MEFLFTLWLPILLSAVGVFIVSSIIHMATPMHKSDYKKLDGEDKLLTALRQHGIKPGHYIFPCAGSMKDMGTPEYKAKCELGPVGYMTVLPSRLWDMNKSLVQWFLFSILVSVLTAYVAGFALQDGAPTGTVFRLVGTVASIGYALNEFPSSIWKGLSWGITMRFVVDGVLYGLTTGAVFALMWPDA